jgi:hypothetical protein
MRHEGFYKLVANEWNAIQFGTNHVERWKNKICHLRQFL